MKSMKKVIATVLALVMVLSLAACGSKQPTAPDLTKYYEDFLASLGEGNTPMTMDITDDLLDAYYPGLSEYELKQCVIKGAAISAVAFEFALVECASEDDVEAVKAIMEARVESQVNGGAMYPATVEAWQNADILVAGNTVALIVANEQQEDAVAAFNALLEQ